MNRQKYTPQPVDTSDVVLSNELSPLLEAMAKNVHEIWAQERMNQGWTFGEKRDDVLKHHPCLTKTCPKRKKSTTEIPR